MSAATNTPSITTWIAYYEFEECSLIQQIEVQFFAMIRDYHSAIFQGTVICEKDRFSQEKLSLEDVSSRIQNKRLSNPTFVFVVLQNTPIVRHNCINSNFAEVFHLLKTKIFVSPVKILRDISKYRFCYTWLRLLFHLLFSPVFVQNSTLCYPKMSIPKQIRFFFN